MGKGYAFEKHCSSMRYPGAWEISLAALMTGLSTVQEIEEIREKCIYLLPRMSITELSSTGMTHSTDIKVFFLIF